MKNNSIDALLDIISKMPIIKPINNGKFISGFGMRFHPIYRNVRMHKGVDFVGKTNGIILATADGIIEKAIYSKTFGNYIIIRHKNNIKTLYAHMSKLKVTYGQKVKRGDVIGIQGSTGTSTGDHIHYEVLIGNRHQNPLNFIRTKEILSNVK